MSQFSKKLMLGLGLLIGWPCHKSLSSPSNTNTAHQKFGELSESSSRICLEAEKGFEELVNSFALEFEGNSKEALELFSNLKCSSKASSENLKRLSFVIGFIKTPLYENSTHSIHKPWILDAQENIVLDPIVKEKLISEVVKCLKNADACSLKSLSGAEHVGFKMDSLIFKLPIAAMRQNARKKKREEPSFPPLYLPVRDYIFKHKLLGIRVPLSEVGYDKRIPDFNYQIVEYLHSEGLSFKWEDYSRILDLYIAMQAIPSLQHEIQMLFNSFAELVYRTKLDDLKQNNVTLGWGGIAISDFDRSSPRAVLSLFHLPQMIRPLAHWSLFEGMMHSLEKNKDPNDRKLDSLIQESKQYILGLQFLDQCKFRSFHTGDLAVANTCPNKSLVLDLFANFGILFSSNSEMSINALKDFISKTQKEDIPEILQWARENSKQSGRTLPDNISSMLLKILVKKYANDSQFISTLIEEARTQAISSSMESKMWSVRILESLLQVKSLHSKLRKIWLSLVENNHNLPSEILLGSFLILWDLDDYQRPGAKTLFDRFAKQNPAELVSAFKSQNKPLSSGMGAALLSGIEQTLESHDETCTSFFNALEILNPLFQNGHLLKEAHHLIDLLATKSVDEDSKCTLSSVQTFLSDYIQENTSSEIAGYVAKSYLSKSDSLAEYGYYDQLVPVLCKHPASKASAPCLNHQEL